MPGIPEPMSKDDVVEESRKTVYQGFFRMDKVTLRHRRFNGEWIGPFHRELFERGEAVCVLLVDPVREAIVLTEQFRIGALEDERSPWLLELVAGMVEPGETYEEVAVRECQEEAGCTPAALRHITTYWVSPGGTNERVAIYCASVNSADMGGIHGLEEEHEDIRVITLPFSEALKALESGVINNAATIIALQWLTIHQKEVFQR